MIGNSSTAVEIDQSKVAPCILYFFRDEDLVEESASYDCSQLRLYRKFGHHLSKQIMADTFEALFPNALALEKLSRLIYGTSLTDVVTETCRDFADEINSHQMARLSNKEVISDLVHSLLDTVERNELTEFGLPAQFGPKHWFDGKMHGTDRKIAERILEEENPDESKEFANGTDFEENEETEKTEAEEVHSDSPDVEPILNDANLETDLNDGALEAAWLEYWQKFGHYLTWCTWIEKYEEFMEPEVRENTMQSLQSVDTSEVLDVHRNLSEEEAHENGSISALSLTKQYEAEKSWEDLWQEHSEKIFAFFYKGYMQVMAASDCAQNGLQRATGEGTSAEIAVYARNAARTRALKRIRKRLRDFGFLFGASKLPRYNVQGGPDL